MYVVEKFQKNPIKFVATTLVLIAALNIASMAFFKYDFIDVMVHGDAYTLDIVYKVVGIAAVVVVLRHVMKAAKAMQK